MKRVAMNNPTNGVTYHHGVAGRLWLVVCLVVFALATLLVQRARGQTTPACCVITAIDTRQNLVSVREASTGRSFEFRANDPAAVSALRVGGRIYVDFPSRQVSLDGKTAFGTIVSPAGVSPLGPSGAQRPPLPAPGLTPPSAKGPIEGSGPQTQPGTSPRVPSGGTPQAGPVAPPAGRPPGSGAAVFCVRPMVEVHKWGMITSVQGSLATARGSYKSKMGPLPGGQKAPTLPDQVRLHVPQTECSHTPVPGQTVFLSADGKTAATVAFPIIVPDTDNCIGRASYPLGQSGGCFIMRNRHVQVSNTGVISGETEIKSEDKWQGFRGYLGIRLLDDSGRLWDRVVGCWGVNGTADPGGFFDRTESWQIDAGPFASRTTKVQLYEGTDCINSFDNLIGEVFGAWYSLIVADTTP